MHDLVREDEDDIAVWLGATQDTAMYEVEELVLAAAKYGLRIDPATRTKLYAEKDEGV